MKQVIFLLIPIMLGESVNAMLLSLEEEGNKVRKASSYGLLYRFILVALNQIKNRRVEVQSFEHDR